MDAPQLGEPSSSRSARVRVKSQRAVEAETTQRLLAQARKAQVAASEIESASSKPSPARRKSVAKRTKVVKGRKDELFCVCRQPTSEDDGPMIECGECNDWFHFSCVDLDEESAERLHTYMCPDCESSTGKKSVAKYDISTFRSPSPLPGEIVRKSSLKRAATPIRSDSSSDSDQEEAEIDNSSSSDSGSDAAVESKPRKRARIKDSPKARVKKEPPKGKAKELSGARVFILDKLANLVKKLFGDAEVDASGYAAELEESLFEHFKEGQGVGGRYKTQFNLLDKSLPNARPDLLESIRSGALPAAKVALLTSADLASAERLEELEKAKQAALAQTVKSREDMTGVVRLGRDGFEKVEDAREKEMVLLARQEEAARAEAERRREAKQEEVVPEVAVATEKREIPMPRSESLDEVPNFAITSAWTGPNEGEAMQFSLEDQTALDLSDLIEVEPEVEPVVLEEPEPEPEVRAPALHAKPVVWSGQLFNPSEKDAQPSPVDVRLIASPRPVDFSVLLPHSTIEITGRVPTQSSLKYLSENRLNPAKDLVVVVFCPSGEDLAVWNTMVDFLIARDRHAIYLPYGQHPPPSAAAKELYLIPLRPADPSPEFTDLIDGYELPERSDSVFLGVFVANKPVPPVVASAPSVQIAPMPSIPQVPSVAPMAPMPLSAPAPLPNDKLQALMASLNPVALQSVASPSPYVPQPYVPVSVPTVPAPTPYVPPYVGGYTPPNQGYQSPLDARQYEPYPRADEQEHARGQGYGSRRGRDWEKTRDSGWGSRGRR